MYKPIQRSIVKDKQKQWLYIISKIRLFCLAKPYSSQFCAKVTQVNQSPKIDNNHSSTILAIWDQYQYNTASQNTNSNTIPILIQYQSKLSIFVYNSRLIGCSVKTKMSEEIGAYQTTVGFWKRQY